MISVIGKQLIFPNEEQRFVMGDGETTSRTFVINRYEADRIDLSPLIFRLDVEYKGGQKDTLLLVKTIAEEQVYLQWDIRASDLKENGTVFVALRAFDTDGVVRWTSAKTPIFINNIIDTPGSWEGDLTELEQMEQRISTVLDSEAERKAAEEKRQADTAAIIEEAREAAEEARNAEGPVGPKGEPGKDGYTPIKGVDYFDGEKGDPFTYADFTPEQLAALKGQKGDPGKDGKDGYIPVKGVDYFDGEKGEPGKDGYTPVKGVDYFDGVDGKNGYTPIKGVDYFDGERGEKGEPGRGLDVKRNFATEDALRAGAENPTGGDTYSVGTEAPFDIYIYDEAAQEWVNHGPLQGPRGEKGDKGDPGDDYVLTDADMSEIAAKVYGLVANGNEVAY